MGKRNILKPDRRFACLRLLPEEHKLIAHLGRGEENSNENMATRDDVFRILAEIAAISLPDVPQPKPRKNSPDYGVKGLEFKAVAKEIGPITLATAPEQERKSLRVSMPQGLDDQLARLTAALNRPKVEILVELAKHFREKYRYIEPKKKAKKRSAK